MLIILEESLERIDPAKLDQLRSLENLLISFYQQNHVLFIEMKSLRIMQHRVKDKLGQTSLATLNLLYQRMTEYKSLVGLMKHKVFVYLDDQNNSGVRKETNGWRIPLCYFSNSSLLSSTIFGENGNDAELYLIFADLYRAKELLNGFLIKGRKMSGGGSETPDNLKNYLESETSPCLCVTDSDKFHPSYSKSSTVEKCEGIESRSANKIFKHLSLEEREIENLIPHEVLMTLPGAKEFIRELNSHIVNDIDHWKYVDIKKGIDLEWIKKRDPKTQLYWKKADKNLYARKSRCTMCGKKSKNIECSCSKICGLGDKALIKIIEHLKSQNEKLSLRCLQDDTRWEMVAQLTLNFAIAPRVERVRA